jgi:DnaJ-class molecular chaperone
MRSEIKRRMKMKTDTTTTQDLFKVYDCPNCNGEGKFHNEKDNYEIIEDCDICKGTGTI